jgi:hypothetical protein
VINILIESPEIMDVPDVDESTDRPLQFLAPTTSLTDVFRRGGCRDEIRDAEEVNPDKSLSCLLDRICDFLRDYMVFSTQEEVIPIALWVAHTHVISAFEYTPYLHIYSPEKQCGKTRLLDCLELLVAKPWRAISPSEAVLFRKIEKDQPTLLFDEVDTIFSRNKEERNEGLRALLNAGFERKATIPRCVGKNFEVQDFAVFCPKALAGIRELPDTVQDRSIPIKLARRSSDEPVRQFRKRNAEETAAPIRSELDQWAKQEGVLDILCTARPDIPDSLSDRQTDICEPLLAIADLAEGKWPELSRVALELLCNTRNEDQSLNVKLLQSVRDVFDSLGANRLSTEDLLNGLVDLEDDMPWGAWWDADIRNGNTRGPGQRLARLLKPYSIKSRGIRLANNTTPRGYIREDFEEAWKRYCPAIPP